MRVKFVDTNADKYWDGTFMLDINIDSSKADKTMLAEMLSSTKWIDETDANYCYLEWVCEVLDKNHIEYKEIPECDMEIYW